jgi:hypothetical protein
LGLNKAGSIAEFPCPASRLVIDYSVLMKKTLCLSIGTLVLLTACATRAAKSPVAVYQQPREPTAITDVPSQEDIEKTDREQAEMLDSVVKKMDEYQDLLAICEKIGGTEEDAQYRASCKTLLGDLKKQLLGLSEHFQDQ